MSQTLTPTQNHTKPITGYRSRSTKRFAATSQKTKHYFSRYSLSVPASVNNTKQNGYR